MSNLYRRGKSGVWYFRMDVPRDIQHLAGGKTSWQHSLRTNDHATAAERCPNYVARYKSEVTRLRTYAASDLNKRAESVVDKSFAALTEFYGSLDRAVAAELTTLAWTVRGSWSKQDAALVEREIFGKEITDAWEYDCGPVRVFSSPREEEQFKLRARLFESGQGTSGLVYQELAELLLAAQLYEPLGYEVGCMAYYSEEIDIASPPAYDAVARAYLTKLANHQFSSWPTDLREALSPIVIRGNASVPVPPSTTFLPATVPSPARSTLQDAFRLWKARKGVAEGEPHKTADEFATAIRRFELLHGTPEIDAITVDMIKSFRRQVSELPYRPKKEVAAMPLPKQIEHAHEHGLPTLSPPTVGKQVAAIRAMLSEAMEAGWVGANVAAGVTVDGARWEGTERDHFSDDDMRLIYQSPMMTKPDACGDAMFWVLFLAPFHGSRPGEHCKLKPDEIVRDGGEWLIRIRADRKSRRVDPEAPVARPRRTKTKSSIRDVPIHRILIAAGFLEFAEMQRQRGAEWLFDELVEDKYGDRYKFLSREINKSLRTLGITDPNKSFYSTRHSMKREGRRHGIAAQNLDQLACHAAGSVGARYGQGIPADVLKADIDRLEFRSVDWDPVVACAKARIARLRERTGVSNKP